MQEQTWSMNKLVQELHPQTEDLLLMNLHLFQNVSIQDSRHNFDNYMILGCLRSATLREHIKYNMGQM